MPKPAYTDPRLMRLPIEWQRNVAIDAAKDNPDSLDTYGHTVDDWQTLFRTRARIETLDGGEFETAHKFFGIATHRVTVRYVRGLRVRDRVLFEGRTLYVLHINDVENTHREVRAIAQEQAA